MSADPGEDFFGDHGVFVQSVPRLPEWMGQGERKAPPGEGQMGLAIDRRRIALIVCQTLAKARHFKDGTPVDANGCPVCVVLEGLIHGHTDTALDKVLAMMPRCSGAPDWSETFRNEARRGENCECDLHEWRRSILKIRLDSWSE
jgi:hypothetical protein